MIKKSIICVFLIVSQFALGSVSSYKVMHYNILAKHLGNNFEPWFKYSDVGDQDLLRQQSCSVKDLMYAKDQDGNYKYPSLRKVIDQLSIVDEGEADRDFTFPPYTHIFSCEHILSILDFHNRYFDWDKRQPKILQRIQDEQPDLMSLVEFDAIVDIGQALENMGYRSIYAKRPNSKDGIGFFYNDKIFSLERYEIVEFQSDECSHNRIGLIARLRKRSSDEPLIFVSTHLMREPMKGGLLD
ncbi:MAG: hypothetical protein HRU09_19885 [Oligoflexales bacterium]|nr:hypothetical protein [Oligoflexales bacterium]